MAMQVAYKGSEPAPHHALLPREQMTTVAVAVVAIPAMVLREARAARLFRGARVATQALEGVGNEYGLRTLVESWVGCLSMRMSTNMQMMPNKATALGSVW